MTARQDARVAVDDLGRAYRKLKATAASDRDT